MLLSPRGRGGGEGKKREYDLRRTTTIVVVVLTRRKRQRVSCRLLTRRTKTVVFFNDFTANGAAKQQDLFSSEAVKITKKKQFVSEISVIFSSTNVKHRSCVMTFFFNIVFQCLHECIGKKNKLVSIPTILSRQCCRHVDDSVFD